MVYVCNLIQYVYLPTNAALDIKTSIDVLQLVLLHVFSVLFVFVHMLTSFVALHTKMEKYVIASLVAPSNSLPTAETKC